jgi:prepilin-type N-terminal cleavage/methylation domain-containing protein
MRALVNRRGSAFTMVEMLVVVAIIGVLVALLLPAVKMVQRKARVASARAEAKNIEAAWRQYLAEYDRWPTSEAIRVNAAVAALLADGAASSANPKRLRFMQPFRRVNASGSPVTPWADRGKPDGSTPTNYFYYTAFDHDYDTFIRTAYPGCGVGSVLTNTLQQRVIVWTFNPDAQPGDIAVIGSWQ